MEKLSIGDVIHYDSSHNSESPRIIYYTVVIRDRELCVQRFDEAPIPLRRCTFPRQRTIKIVKFAKCKRKQEKIK